MQSEDNSPIVVDMPDQVDEHIMCIPGWIATPHLDKDISFEIKPRDRVSFDSDN